MTTAQEQRRDESGYRAAEQWAVAGLFAITRLAVFALAFLSNLRIEKTKHYQKLGQWTDPLFQWDSYWYLSIVRDGYQYTPGAPSNVAFFPLYPLLVRLVGGLLGDDVLAGFVVSNLCLLGACFALYRLARVEGQTVEEAQTTLLCMLVFPSAFFASLFYTEGLFLLLTIGAFLAARLGRWGWAALAVALAGATRIYGVFLLAALPFFAVRLQMRPPFLTWLQPWRRLGWLALGPAGVLAYMAYLQHRFGVATAFIHSQREWRGQTASPLDALAAVRGMQPFDALLWSVPVAVAVAAVGVLAWRRWNPAYWIFPGLVLAVLLSSGTVMSAHRYVGALFPVFLAAGLLANRHPVLRSGVLVVFAMGMSLLLILFVAGYPIY